MIGMIPILFGAACAEQEAGAQECSPFYYENFGAGFLTENCQGCHALNAQDRRGAPLNVSFDDENSILSHREIVITELEQEEMPPAGGLSEAEREVALEWLYCMEEQ